MQIFTKYLTYSVKMLECFLEGSNELVSVKDMTSVGVPRSYSVRILAQLSKLGCVKAKEGRGGGYKLIGDGRSALIKLFGEKSWTKAKDLLN